MALVSAVYACGSADSDGGQLAPVQQLDAGPPPVRALYEPGPLPLAFGAVPWPDNAYLDARGRVRVSDIPSQAGEDYAVALADAMADLDGFGVRPTVYFWFDGALDPESLPASPEKSLATGATVFLVDADTSSPSAFERIPVDVHYDARARQISLRPSSWRSLVPGRLYAAAVTRAVKAEDGGLVDGAERFLAIRDAQSELADPLDRAARARYAPVLETLDDQGVPRERVIALALFRVQSVRDLDDARALLRQTAPPPPAVTEAVAAVDLDAVLGTPVTDTVGLDSAAPHEHIGWMVHGSFTSQNLTAERAGTHGAFERDAVGGLRVKREEDVPFTVWLPRGLAPGGAMPVVIVQHDLGGDRSDALAVANEFASSGYVVIAADAPFHGLRSGAGDRRSRFTDSAGPDGFGDAPADFEGSSDADGELVPLHPFYYRDAVRQGVVDLMQLVHVIQKGDWSALRDVDPELEQLELDGSRIGFVGIGRGADAGVLLSSLEPDVGPLVLAFPEGCTIDGWIDSPARSSLVAALWERLGLDPEPPSDPSELLRSPDVDVFRALIDRANSAAYAPVLRRLPINALLLVARDDEVAHNAGTEALAHALATAVVGGPPEYVTELPVESLRPGATFRANLDVQGGAITRVLYVLDPATHDTLTRARGSAEYEHPLHAPFTRLDPPVVIDNPIAATLTQAAFFFESYRACRLATPTAVCAASVMAQLAPE